MEYEQSYVRFLEKLQHWSKYSGALAEMWQLEEKRQKGRKPDETLIRLRKWAANQEVAQNAKG